MQAGDALQGSGIKVSAAYAQAGAGRFTEAAGTAAEAVPLARARGFDLPFITEVVIAEIIRLLDSGGVPDSVPFFDNSGSVPQFRRIG